MDRYDLYTLIEETRATMPADFALDDEDLVLFLRMAEADAAKAFEAMYYFGMSQGAAAERSVHTHLAETLSGMSILEIEKLLESAESSRG